VLIAGSLLAKQAVLWMPKLMSTTYVGQSTGFSVHVNSTFAWAGVCTGLLTPSSFTQVARCT